MLSVTSTDGLLHVDAYTCEQDIQNHVHALLQACGSKGPGPTKMISSDNPEPLDKEPLHAAFGNAVVSGDPLHVGPECGEMCQWAHDQHFQMHQSGGSKAQTWIGRQPPLLQVRNDSTPTEFHFKHKSAS